MKGESFKTMMFRHGINIYPMFWGTGGKVVFIRGDWSQAIVKIKLRLRTRNYVGTIFGGSQFAAADPFHMVLLINIMGHDYIIWDKAATITFKKPGRGTIMADFVYTPEEVREIREKVEAEGRYEFKKAVNWIDAEGDTVSILEKTIYVATKAYFKQRQAEKAAAEAEKTDH